MAVGTVVDVVMPQMGVSVSEGTVSRWLKNEGDTIERDETLLEISTDKVDTEVPSPASGVVSKILVPEGETIDVGVKLAEISVGGEAGASSAGAAPADEVAAAPPAQAPASAAPAAAAPTLAAPAASAQPAPASAPPSTNGSGSAPAAPAAGGASRFVSPVVGKIAAEHGIDPSVVPGSGNGGRVTKKDILSFIQSGGTSAIAAPPVQATFAQPSVPGATFAQPHAPAVHPSVTSQPRAMAEAAPAPAAGFSGEERVENFNTMRKAIARHMTESVKTSAHVTSTMEVDMTRVVRMRNQIKDELLATWGVKVTFTHFVVRALIDGIAHWPLVNAEIRGESAVIKSYVNLGVAVALDGGAGLIVPVVKHAEEKNLVGIARAINDLAGRARNKQLSPDDVTGGTFTLTNPGIYGAVHGTPIINQPQVAILDTEAIVKRPIVVTDVEGNDTIAIRSMMNLCMSYDHRLIDGAYAVQFLAHVKRNLQEWELSRFSG